MARVAQRKAQDLFGRIDSELALLTQDDLKSLEALNSRLWSWVEAEYHMSPHFKGLDGITPFDRWATAADDVDNTHLPGPERDLDELFLFELNRKVQKDRTISLQGVVYEIDACLVGQTVTVRFDPSRRGRPIDVYFNGFGRKYQKAKTVDTYANCFVRRDHTTKHLHPRHTT